MRSLKVGVVLPLFSGDPAKVLDNARGAEAMGFDGAFAFDHFFPPGAPSDRPALEAYASLAAVAVTTRRLTIGTLVTRAMLRPVSMVAKMATTLDQISGGRMILALGTGDSLDDPEHRAFGFRGMSVSERRAHLAESVQAIRALFHGRSFPGGAWVPAMSGPLLPPPVQAGGPKIWLGAQSLEVVRMAGRLADGWNGWGNDADVFAQKAALLAEEAALHGRSSGDVEATWAGIALVGEDEAEAERLHQDRLRKGMDSLAFCGSAERFAAFLNDLHAAGATWVIVVAAGPSDRRALIADRVLPALA